VLAKINNLRSSPLFNAAVAKKHESSAKKEGEGASRAEREGAMPRERERGRVRQVQRHPQQRNREERVSNEGMWLRNKQMRE